MHIPAAITFFQRVNNPSRAFWNWCASVAHHSISRSAPQREELFFYKQAQSQQGSGLDISRHLGSNLARGCMGGEWVYSSLEGATPYPPSVRRTCMGSWRTTKSDVGWLEAYGLKYMDLSVIFWTIKRSLAWNSFLGASVKRSCKGVCGRGMGVLLFS